MGCSGPTSAASDLAVPGLGVAPGRSCGPLRRNRSELAGADVRNSILLAQRARPEDVDRILAAAGTLTLGGALLSHVNLLSREFGKPSVALLPETRPRLIPEGGRELLEIRIVPGAPGEPLRLDEGDVVLLDGDLGLLRVPGGNDRSMRKTIRRTYAALAAYALEPGAEDRLHALVTAAEELELSVLRMLLEAALLCRVVPPGEPSQQLVRALRGSQRRDIVESILRDLGVRLVAQIEQRCNKLLTELDGMERRDELDRNCAGLEARVSQDRAVLAVIGGDPTTSVRALQAVGRAASRRKEALRVGIAREVETALSQPGRRLEKELVRYERLLHRAREARVGDALVLGLVSRLAGPAERRRHRAGQILIVKLDDPLAADSALVGGKAAGLTRLLDRLPDGCRIPSGFVVTASAYRLHLLGEAGEKIRSAIDRGGPEAAVSRLARAAIFGVPLPPELVAAVGEALRELGGGRMAVRSSATIEDGGESSLAGQFDTYLGVDGLDELLDRIRWTWASLWNSHALRLLAGSGRSPLSAGMAVLVQEAVPTRTAGVMFTRDPSGHSGSVLINAAWGLGEAISQGEVQGDLFWVERRSGEATAVRPGHPDRRIVLDPERRGTLAEDLPAGLRGRLCLDDEQLSRLAALARRIDRDVSRPMDVEFGFDDENTLHLFQARRAPVERVSTGRPVSSIR